MKEDQLKTHTDTNMKVAEGNRYKVHHSSKLQRNTKEDQPKTRRVDTKEHEGESVKGIDTKNKHSSKLRDT